MNRKVIFYLVFLILLMPVLVSAQIEKGLSLNRPVNSFMGTQGFLDNLLNPDKFNISHSYSISCFNFGNQTMSQGLFLSTLNYKFSNPLTMQIKVGFLNQPFGGFNSSGSNNTIFLQRAMLKYQPSANMTFTVDFQQIPQGMVAPYRRYYW